MLDLRKPAGVFFLLLGLLLAAAGVFADFRAPLLNSNLNLQFGLFSLALGGIFLWLARKA